MLWPWVTGIWQQNVTGIGVLMVTDIWGEKHQEEGGLG